MVFVVEALTTNILPTNEATMPTFTSDRRSDRRGAAQVISKIIRRGRGVGR